MILPAIQAAESLLWQYYIQLVAVEQAFKNLKGDLAIRPVWAPAETDPDLQWRYAGAASRLTVKAAAGVSLIEVEMANTAPFPLSVTLRHGRNETKLMIPADSELTARVAANQNARVLEIASQTWNPADTLGSADNRVIGAGVRTITVSRG